MKLSRNKKVLFMVVVAVLIAVAYICRLCGKIDFHPYLTGSLRNIIFVVLLAAWGISVNYRVVQSQVKRYLGAVDFLMIFWIIERSVKYWIVTDAVVTRYLWYLFYVPILAVPLISILVALSLGKPEAYHLPKRVCLLWILTAAMIMMVITNDLHQFVFTIPENMSANSNASYRYSTGYWMCALFVGTLLIAAVLIMFRRCRLPDGRMRILLPFVPITVSFVYFVLYVLGVPWLMLVAGDLPAFSCYACVALFESCIQTGLIRSNTAYGALVEASSINVRILDKKGNIRYSSAASENSTANKPTERSIITKSYPIRGGSVVWQEDVTELTDTLEQLADNNNALKESNLIEKENYDAKMQINALQEKNRLYALLQEQTAQQNNMLVELLDEYEASANSEFRRLLLSKSVVIGAYIKRVGNLIFIEQEQKTVCASEIAYAVKETFAGLRLMGAECALAINPKEELPTECAIRIYTFLENAVEATLNDIRSVWMSVHFEEDRITVRLKIESDDAISMLTPQVDYVYKDGIHSMVFTLCREVSKNV